MFVLAIAASALGLGGSAQGRELPPLAGDPVISSEYAVSDPQASAQHDPSIAFDGTNYLVAWGETAAPYLRGARLSQSGVHLDGPGIDIASGLTPSVAFDGTNYLVVWATRGGPPQIKSVRVDQDGVVVGPEITLTTSGMFNWQRAPSIAFNGSNYLVVWQDETDIQGFTDLRGALISPSGAVLQNPIQITNAGGDQGLATVAADGVRFLVVWQDQRSGGGIYGTRVGANGEVLEPAGIPIATGQLGYTGVAFDGENYFVVWGFNDVSGKRVSPDGTVLDSSPIAISTAPSIQADPSVAFNGTDYVVAWEDLRSGADYDIYGARITPGGVVLDPSGLPISASPTHELSTAVAAGPFGRVAISYQRFAEEPPYGDVSRAFLRLFDDGVAPPAAATTATTATATATATAASTATTSTATATSASPPPPPPAHCRVPRVLGLRISNARQRIRRANCSVGRVRRVRTRRSLRGRVIGQSPRPGAVRRRGFPVNLLVGR